MRFKGYVDLDDAEDGLYFVEIPALDVATQGTSVADAKRMARSALVDLLSKDGSAKVILHDAPGGEFWLEIPDPKVIAPLMLKNLRARSGISLSELAQRLGGDARNKNGPAQYEQGRREPTLHKFQELLSAMGFDFEISIVEKQDETKHRTRGVA